MTTTVKPVALVELNHRNYWSSTAASSFGFCACAYSKRISYIDQQFRTHQIPGDWERRLYGSSILESNDSENKVRLAIRHGNKLTVVDLEGNIEFQCNSPEGARHYFGASHFDHHRNELWLSTTLSKDKFEIRILDTNSWKVVEQRVMDDPMSDHSGQSFYHTYQPGIVGMDLTTGGCGDAFYILDRENGISFEEAVIDEARYVVFSPYRKEFLANAGHTGIVRFGYPRVGWFDDTSDLNEALSEASGVESYVSGSIAYLSSGSALITDENSIGVLNLATMTLQDTIKVELGEWASDPRVGDKSMHWSWFERIHDQIVFVQSHGFDEEQKTLIWVVPVEQF